MMQKIKFNNSISGFTLLETAIAIFISILVITSSLYAFNRNLSLIQTAKDINLASSYLRGVCEYIRYTTDSSTTGTVPSRDTIVSEYPLPDLNDANLIKNTSESQDASQSPVPVEVILEWKTESQKQRSIKVNMLIAQRQKA